MERYTAEDMFDVRKNLFMTEKVKVFLRVRPSINKRELEESKECLEIQEDMRSVVMRPKTLFTAETIDPQRFNFSRVYGPDTSQKDFFEGTSLKVVKDFVHGQNVFILSYGAANAGKVCTLQ